MEVRAHSRPFDQLLELLVDAVVSELIQKSRDNVERENPRAGQSCAGFLELDDADSTPKD
jgi:hypothetical protein